MEVSVNFDDCIGCGVCMQVCPEVFGLDEESGKAVLLDGGSHAGKGDLIKEAVDSCPIGCINA
jgi:ferredoxin